MMCWNSQSVCLSQASGFCIFNAHGPHILSVYLRIEDKVVVPAFLLPLITKRMKNPPLAKISFLLYGSEQWEQ